jgi:hypothetical protein
MGTTNTFQGQLTYYRIFDIGSEIDMAGATELLSKQSVAEHFRLRRSSRAMVIDAAPVVLTFGSWQQVIGERTYAVSAVGKMWNFGALSIALRIEVEKPMAMDELSRLSQLLEDDPSMHDQALGQVEKILKELSGPIKKPHVWEQFEDYLIYTANPKSMPESEVRTLPESEDFQRMILGEPSLEFSEQQKNFLRQSSIQYGKSDLVVIDWNSAFILSEGDSQDIADVIEFALCQLLELRYYDDLLDRKLGGLYKAIQETKTSVWSEHYAQFSKEAAMMYIEISDIIEKIENSLKVIGDFYYARIFRAALERFRCKDWQQSVDNKLKNLAEVSMIFQGQINERRNQLLEIVIIVLIAVEVVPFLVSLISKIPPLLREWGWS